MKKRGRPSKYAETLAAEICTRLAAGESLNAICRDEHMPDAHRVREWALDDREGFSPRYARARAVGLEKMADELVEISDADYTGPDGHVDHARVQQARLMSDNRKWILSKMLPKRYGDRVEITGDPSVPILSRIELVAVRPPPPELPALDGSDEATVMPLRALPSR